MSEKREPSGEQYWPCYADVASEMRFAMARNPLMRPSMALSCAFHWKEHPRGWAFWNNVCTNLEDSNG